MDTQLFIQGQNQMDFLPEVCSFSHGSSDDSDTSSPCSTHDGLDFLSFGVPEVFFPQDFEFPTSQSGMIPDTTFGPFGDQLNPIPFTQNANECYKNASQLDENINHSPGLYPMGQGAKQTTPPPTCVMPDCALPGQQALHHIPENLPFNFSVEGSLFYHGDPNASRMSQSLISNMTNEVINNETTKPSSTKDNSTPRTTKESNNRKTRIAIQSLRKRFIPDQMKDEKYWRRRLRNNWSAKKSREAKRAKDTLIHSKITFLENENRNLKLMIARLLAEKNSNHCNIPPWEFSNQLI